MPMSVAERALWVIERNHGCDLTLDEIARACRVSKFHLAHAFGRRTGLSVMQYLRGRRLSAAAVSLSKGAPDILDLALQSGYASHEAFSRAFRARFGATPEAVRANGSLDKLPLVEPAKLDERDIARIAEPRFADAGEIRAVGRGERYAFDAIEKIPGQWQRFMAVAHEIPNVLPGIPIGIATNVDAEGMFDYVSAVEVSSFDGAPKGLARVTVPPRRYVVFDHDDHVSTIGRTYAAIWDRWLPDHGVASADAPSIERHKPSFDPRTGDGGVEIWIPVEG